MIINLVFLKYETGILVCYQVLRFYFLVCDQFMNRLMQIFLYASSPAKKLKIVKNKLARLKKVHERIYQVDKNQFNSNQA